MIFPDDQIAELKSIAPDLSYAEEGGYPYFYISGLKMPEGCVPDIVDALLCPYAKDGYTSSFYLSSQISGCPQRNWNRMNVRILDRNWFAISWQQVQGKRLVEMLLSHLNAFRRS